MVPIRSDRDDGPWPYVERAVATALDRPYRQRVYHLVKESGGVRSEVYECPATRWSTRRHGAETGGCAFERVAFPQ